MKRLCLFPRMCFSRLSPQKMCIAKIFKPSRKQFQNFDCKNTAAHFQASPFQR